MKIKRVDVVRGNSVTFSYDSGDRYVYISKGSHPELKQGKPVKILPDQDIKITTETDIQVSCMYE